jgi:hypothetical protein
MSETVDLTLLAAGVQGIEREMRLLRVQLDQLAGAVPPRLASIDALALLEQSVHSLSSELARGFGQMQQQHARTERRFEAMDAGLTLLRTEIATGNATLLQAIKGDA